MTTRKEILESADRCVNGDRENQYGSPENNFKMIAMFWNEYLSDVLDGVITPVDVAMMMVLLKIARIKSGTATEDSFVDLAGYAACGGELNGQHSNVG